ncbi:MAG: lipoyl(octanoyl) transferase LipB [Nitrososphaerota archaeon]|nr:lipoyl(octanoyl) transferase LipB [Aigarchaeota archaeon]MDW8076441.1 lipoyl(octanoyl) transferase LipB [Nitrososphaerota archaeon]
MKKGFLVDLGLCEYEPVWKLQLKLVELRLSSEIPDTLLLVEHKSVFTLGRRTSMDDVIEKRAPVFRVERGGGATYHGPGQLVGYPIMDLNAMKLDIKQYIRKLENVLVRTLLRFNVAADIKEGYPGVWVGEKKIASIGIAIRNWVAFHGFAVNINPDMSYFRCIRPCGMRPEVMSSVEELLGASPELDRVKEALIKEFETEFDLNLRPFPSDLWKLVTESIGL